MKEVIIFIIAILLIAIGMVVWFLFQDVSGVPLIVIIGLAGLLVYELKDK